MDYKVTDTELTSIANAIRTKGGTSAQLTFPNDFVTAIGNIPSGGGGGINLNYELYVQMAQGSMTISANDLNKTIEFAWNGGNVIGSNAIMLAVIPKEVQSISFHLAVGTGYGSGSNVRFNVGLGLTATPDINKSAGDANFSSNYQALFLTRSINTEDDYVLDCSNVNVDTALVISSIGYNATFSNITFNY